MTGHVDGDMSLETLPSLDTLFELDKMSDVEYSQALKAGESSILVVIRPTGVTYPRYWTSQTSRTLRRHLVRVVDLRSLMIILIRFILW